MDGMKWDRNRSGGYDEMDRGDYGTNKKGQYRYIAA
jgi:hypothetical protein